MLFTIPAQKGNQGDFIVAILNILIKFVVEQGGPDSLAETIRVLDQAKIKYHLEEGEK